MQTDGSSPRTTPPVMDLELYEETALAMAQFVISDALRDSGLSRAEAARRMGRSRSFVTRILSGEHNLTVKTLARALGACGKEISFQGITPVASWSFQADESGLRLVETISDDEQHMAA